VRVCEGGVDLNGPGVALECALHVLHLLESVAHVGVGVGEGGLDANGLLVVQQRLIQLALLLQHGRQVGVGGGELREHVERLQVEPRRLLDVALLALDVGQVVEAVGVRGAQPQRRVVALLGLGHLTLLLQRVRQVAVGVREVGLQFDGASVRVDGQVYQAARGGRRNRK
jgi:hypothetical protein